MKGGLLLPWIERAVSLSSFPNYSIIVNIQAVLNQKVVDDNQSGLYTDGWIKHNVAEVQLKEE